MNVDVWDHCMFSPMKIVGKVKIGFTIQKDKVKDVVYNVMKEMGKIIYLWGEMDGSSPLNGHPKTIQCNTERKSCITEDSITNSRRFGSY